MQGEGTEDDIASKDREDVLSKGDQVRDVVQSKVPTVPGLTIKRLQL